jgi:hypothetical protein
MKLVDFREDEFEIEESKVVEILKGIYEEKVYAEYLAGSLCYCYPVDNHPKGRSEFLIVFNPHIHMSDEINYWIAKLYIKNKNDKCTYWEVSKLVIANYEVKNEKENV